MPAMLVRRIAAAIFPTFIAPSPPLPAPPRAAPPPEPLPPPLPPPAAKPSGADEKVWEELAIGFERELTAERARSAQMARELEDLRAELDRMKRRPGKKNRTSRLPDKPKRQTVLDVVAQAEERHANLVILPSALKSASDSPYANPPKVTEALAQLNSIAESIARGEGGPVVEMLHERFPGKRMSMHVSTTALGCHGGEYMFPWKGRRTLFEPHITLGSGNANTCLSIHYLFEDGKFVIAHVGRHLSNTLS